MGIAQEFFAEREYRINATNVSEYVSALESLFRGASSLDNEGISPAPFGANDLCFFFRGQTNGSFGLNSSLYRSVSSSIDSSSPPAQVERVMERAEARVIEQARAQGIGRNLTSLELLTVLQHHLIPTRLIDVSASWQVGLYFASEEMDSIEGRIFVIAVRPSLWEEFPKTPVGAPNWPSPTEHPWQQTTWPVLLPFTDPRMISQQGYFLAGGIASNNGGHHQYWNNTEHHKPKGNQRKLPLTNRELREVSTLMIKFPMLSGSRSNPLEQLRSEYKGVWTAVALTIPVPSNLKHDIRKELDDRYKINRNSIYPPIDESSRLLKYVAGSVS